MSTDVVPSTPKTTSITDRKQSSKNKKYTSKPRIVDGRSSVVINRDVRLDLPEEAKCFFPMVYLADESYLEGYKWIFDRHTGKPKYAVIPQLLQSLDETPALYMQEFNVNKSILDDVNGFFVVKFIRICQLNFQARQPAMMLNFRIYDVTDNRLVMTLHKSVTLEAKFCNKLLLLESM